LVRGQSESYTRGVQICPNCGEENPARFRLCGFCGAQLAPEITQETRKTVTIVFSDLKGSTNLGEALDSESLREVMSRYFDEMREILEHHGGRVEKYIGDAIMAVFGLPRLHEDDALRAVRAALAMQEALRALNEELETRWGVQLENRTGVNTGEVVAGDPVSGQRLVIGDAVNVAARLEQAAPALEILVGEPTYRLVSHAVEVEPVEPLPLKGKSEPVPAYRLLAVKEAVDTVARHHYRPLVGRETELAQLDAELGLAAASRSCRLVTILADAGVGKSRLIEEFGQTAEARVYSGRCLPYGRGHTYWPLSEIFRGAAAIPDEDTPEQAIARLATLFDDAQEVTDRVASAIGLSPVQFAPEELFWGVRKGFEALAADEPLVAVFEDIHWAESTLVDLIEHLVGAVSGVPVLLLCASRPDLLEQRPAWSEHEILTLEPLSERESERVIENALGAEVAAKISGRIIEAAEGNPLFVEQLLSMLVDDGVLRKVDGQWVTEGDLSELAIPATINALLSARLDQLSPEQRAVIEPASVIGHVFEQAALKVLVEEAVRGELEALLAGLIEKQMIRPEPTVDEEPKFRFDHILIRDAAYNGILKRVRATLHERFANWGERVNRERERETEYDELLGYHLEQAHDYLSGLGPLDAHGLKLGDRAAGHLASAGKRAFTRADMPAAANLLRRAVTLLPADDRERLELLPDLGEALMETGECAWAQMFLDEAVEEAVATGDARLEAGAVLTRLLVRHPTAEDLDSWRQEVEREARRAIDRLEGDDSAHAELAKAWRLLGFVHGTVLRYGEAAEAVQQATEHARLAGDARQEARSASSYTLAALHGPTPVPEAIARSERLLAQGLATRQAEGLVLCVLAHLRAMQGDFDEARDLYTRARALLEELGVAVVAAWTSLESSAVEMLAGEPARAEERLRPDYEALTGMGEKFFLPLLTALLARSVLAQGRPEEAAEIAGTAIDLAAEDDIEPQALSRGVRARILASEGKLEEAELLAREAVELMRKTDAPVKQGDALLDLAEVLVKSGQTRAAQAVIEESKKLYESKQSTVAHARADALLAELESARSASASPLSPSSRGRPPTS
jgi:predicted ATPase/class 3 adenylate cyclase